MKKFLIASVMLASVGSALALTPEAQDHYRVWRPYNETVFFDGYQGEVRDKDKESVDGIVRHTNYHYAKKLTAEDLAWFGEDVDIMVTIGALCDNYDRLGNISLSLLPKGSEYTGRAEDMRFELVRFITPFMDKNLYPDEVKYYYDGRLASMIFRDKNLQDKYDYWLEFELFGVPYAANTQITGCAGRDDVFRGTVEFISRDEPAAPTTDHIIIPLWHYISEIHGSQNLNNYNEKACDEVGTTARTWKFTLDSDVNDASLTLNLSNHGANAGGEEYSRRDHFLYVDGELVAQFKPGGKTCEPYRYLNTQSNGIYGVNRRTDLWWELNGTNWCPGDAIPLRVFNLGSLKAGEHNVKISVPDAVFPQGQGDIRVSMHVQAARTGTLPAGVDGIDAENAPRASYNGSVVTLSGMEVEDVAIYNYEGALLWGAHTSEPTASLVGFKSGIYLVTFTSPTGETFTYKATR